MANWWWKTRTLQTWRVWPGDRAKAPVKVEERSYQDRYNDPGRPFMHQGPYGRQVLLTAADGRTVFLQGDGASPEGDRPFVDAWNVDSGDKERLFRSEAPHYESPVEMIDARNRQLLTRRESQTEPPNYFVRDLKKGKLAQKTFFPDPTPQLAGISKEMITYRRADGVPLTGTLYLPAGYDKDRDGPLPVLMWAYPTEFKSAKDAGQVTDSPYRFTRVGWWSPMMFLVRGYAVLDDPSMPIIGEGDAEPNDTFVEQLVASAQAAVDELVRRGVGDRDRMAVGGHSYGAFMTANLLAHSDLFRAGLPRSGAYNRTLTPFGFQAEERTLWEAPAGLLHHVALHARGQDRRAHPDRARPGRQQLGHLPHAERAPVRRHQGPGRHRAPGDAAGREPRLPRPRVHHAPDVGDRPLAGAVREERAAAGAGTQGDGGFLAGPRASGRARKAPGSGPGPFPTVPVAESPIGDMLSPFDRVEDRRDHNGGGVVRTGTT